MGIGRYIKKLSAKNVACFLIHFKNPTLNIQSVNCLTRFPPIYHMNKICDSSLNSPLVPFSSLHFPRTGSYTFATCRFGMTGCTSVKWPLIPPSVSSPPSESSVSCLSAGSLVCAVWLESVSRLLVCMFQSVFALIFRFFYFRYYSCDYILMPHYSCLFLCMVDVAWCCLVRYHKVVLDSTLLSVCKQ